MVFVCACVCTDDAECELNCKPIGLEYFALLDERVVDGTACKHPVNELRHNRQRRGGGGGTTAPLEAQSRRAMCVHGVCKVSEGVVCVCVAVAHFVWRGVMMTIVINRRTSAVRFDNGIGMVVGG